MKIMQGRRRQFCLLQIRRTRTSVERHYCTRHKIFLRHSLKNNSKGEELTEIPQSGVKKYLKKVRVENREIHRFVVSIIHSANDFDIEHRLGTKLQH